MSSVELVRPESTGKSVAVPVVDAAVVLRRRADQVLVAAFLLLIAAPLCGLAGLGRDGTIEQVERRRPVAFPAIETSRRSLVPLPKKSALLQFPPAFEAWFGDRLGFRREFIAAYRTAQRNGIVGDGSTRPAMGQDSRTPVIVGRDGWLFFAGDRSLEGYRNSAPFEPGELAQWRSVLAARRDWLAARGIRYLVVVAPDKHTVYDECMPRSIARIGERSRLDQLAEALAGPDGVDLVDLREPLRRAKDRGRTYHRSDTHWNAFGGYVGYAAVMDRLGEWFPAARPLPLDRFDVATELASPDRSLLPDGEECGDLARMLGDTARHREEIVRLVPRTPRRATWPQDRTRDSAPRRRDRVSTLDGAELGGAVVIHDSFVTEFAPYFSEHFHRVRYLWTRDFPVDVVEQERPAVVVEEIVERILMVHEPRNPAELSQPPESRLAPPLRVALESPRP